MTTGACCDAFIPYGLCQSDTQLMGNQAMLPPISKVLGCQYHQPVLPLSE